MFLAIRKSSMKNHSSKFRHSLPRVSFIIPTLNAAHLLSRCLAAIRNQKYPQDKIEIIVADGGSTDRTRHIAKEFQAKIIKNPQILHEPGKTLASQKAHGDILFYTDADNVLADTNWLQNITLPFLDHPQVVGFLPQTVPAPDSNPLDRYLGFLSTDPFTWFIYGKAASPMDYDLIYKPVTRTEKYLLYRFPVANHPLFGFSQGTGAHKSFNRGNQGKADDILAGIKMIEEGSIIAYVPAAKIYHYHISGLANFISKYRWRIRNNLTQTISNMGIIHRRKYLSFTRKTRALLFPFYAFSVIFPILDTVKLTLKHRDLVMLLHAPTSLILSALIVYESVRSAVIKPSVGQYK